MFYDRFVELCKLLGMSPAAVARDMGLSNSSTTTWKRGSIPKGDTLQRIADYFGTTTDYLLGRTDDPENSDRFGIDPPELWASLNNSDDEETAEIPISFNASATLHGTIRGRVSAALDKLNSAGQQEAAKRVEELTEIPRYRAQTAPQSTPTPQEGKDSTPPPAAPETPPDGEQ